MKIFNLYSEYYDLLYQDKNYSAESEYVSNLIKKYRPGAKTVLNLGCGTGKHDFALAKKGYDIVGVDISSEMLAKAEFEKRKLKQSKIKFVQSDIKNFRMSKKFDVIVSLFHVMSYQTKNQDIIDVLETISEHQNKNGLFIFDFWYGPCVLTEKPSVRIKRIENQSIKITRIAEPDIDYSGNTVNVNYDLFITQKKTKKISEIKETHIMRYFFEPEITSFLKNNNYKLLKAEEWMTGSGLSSSSWNAVFICRKTN